MAGARKSADVAAELVSTDVEGTDLAMLTNTIAIETRIHEVALGIAV